MELGRELLAIWGYDRVDDIIWVKTNQLQRLIRTGRTGEDLVGSFYCGNLGHDVGPGG